jgi:hypothetical protein
MHVVLKPISLEKAKEIAAQKGLKPAKVKGTSELEFTKSGNDRLEVIDWAEFEQIANQKGLVVCESGGFLKLKKKA